MIAPSQTAYDIANITAQRVNAGLAKIELIRAMRAADTQPGKLAGLVKASGGATPTPKKPSATSVMRKNPTDETQSDFFQPSVYDVSAKDSRSVMDVAIFRLSKKDRRANATVRFELSDGYVEIFSGPNGMASVWDYDIILMAISHMTEAFNRFKADKGQIPGRVFSPHVSEILSFCHRSRGGRQYDDIEEALDRLNTTQVKIVRKGKSKGGREIITKEAEPFLTRYKTTKDVKSGKITTVEMEVAQWIYSEVVSSTPHVLTMSPDYFLITSGIGKFIYRLARRVAGKNSATYKFTTLYERSGSTGNFKEFCRMLRNGLIANGELPEYNLAEVQGTDGPMLCMTHKGAEPVITDPI